MRNHPVPPSRWLIVLTALLVGCGEAPEFESLNEVDTATVRVSERPEGEWVTLLSRDMRTRSTRPERFRSTSTELRVISTMGPNLSSHNAGFVTTNLLSDETTLPVATVFARQARLDVASVDTTEVTVPSAGHLYFFVAEHRRLPDFNITIQEFRERRP